MICVKCHREIPDDARLCCYCGRVFEKRRPATRRGNGQGSVRHTASGWSVRVTLGWEEREGRPPRQVKTQKSGFPTKAAALEYAASLKTAADAPPVAPSLAHYWALYEEGELSALSASKAMAYRIAWKKLSALAARPVDQLTLADLRGVVAEQAATFYPARDMKQVLLHLYKLAAADGWARVELPGFIILPELHEKERRPFTQEEQAALWKLYESGDLRAALPLIMIYTGMMPGEFQQLRPEMIDWNEHTIRGVGLKTKTRRENPIYLIDALRPVLDDLIAASPSASGYVLARNEAKFYSDYYAALEAAGCRRLEPYSCRHTTATALAVDANIAPATVRKIMRWSTARMLDRYAHPADQDALDAVSAIAPQR